ncbi:uncharacterized protein [Atheta coriaria]|uniref:uncharacterized protein isoform X2 n=1 Tax=Dalotia coriaria TaxID=877792 RepID=UPI0031F36E89
MLIIGLRNRYPIDNSNTFCDYPMNHFRCLTGERNVLGQRFFYQIRANELSLDNDFFIRFGRMKCPRKTIFFIRLCLAGEGNVLGQRFFHHIVSSGRSECPRTTILSSHFV